MDTLTTTMGHFSDDGIDRRAEAEFFKSLGSEGSIKSALEGGDDEKFDKANKISLYRYFRETIPKNKKAFHFFELIIDYIKMLANSVAVNNGV